ncbi:nitroreductase/quinone reductase family protein [Micromonospora polyrhachis]|uniref:Deazaflavin-dependent oxidoreductase (Nitroreductase family) n=1 Tax=Micromonospora polyrhachis TaxID=1282883 RepID=A0A7W7WT58_9ACTN|nr:nitroreductase/quinone reductase family protein [Micromonospora polyrhachis]MBB4962342.1 deazaflavin-dependent oxidoreductase (nitroreductase family) [Micromonospora polyrhachis]
MSIDFNQHIIDEFRANGGRVGGPFEGGRLLLLTTVGARSGTPHTTPVGYLPDGDRVLVIASAAGAPKHPDWFHNLVANPQVTVENGTFTYEAQATVLTGTERDRLFARAVEADPGWADYQAKTSRVIPVVALEQVPAGPPRMSGGPVSMGTALRRIHDAFRRELALVRKEIATSGPRLGAQLRVNCLTVCQGLHVHHTKEDTGMFPALAAQHPDLAPTIDRLGVEHEKIAALLAALQKVISADTSEPELVLAEVDRLTEELERHLVHEEEQLIPILDAAIPSS